MKYLLIAVLILILKTSNAQIKNAKLYSPDSLKRYSYLTSGPTINSDTFKIVNGTGFFIRNSKGLFFLTARHVYNGCNPALMKDIDYPNSMAIHAKFDSSSISYYVDIKKIKDTSPCISFLDKPDLIITKITDSGLQKVFSIEDFLEPEYEQKINIQMNGYPTNRQPTREQSSIFVSSDHFIITSDNNLQHLNKIDSINYWIEPKNMRVDSSLKGFSGSPVFAQDSKSKNWQFMGMQVGIFEGRLAKSNSNKGWLIVCKSKYVLSELNKYITLMESKNGL